MLQCNDGTSNEVSDIIRRHIDNRKLLLICILLLSHYLIFFRFLFYKYMTVFLFNTAIYVFLLEESMYSYCCLCILIVSLCILDRLCGLVVRVSGYRYRGPGFDSRRYQIF